MKINRKIFFSYYILKNIDRRYLGSVFSFSFWDYSSFYFILYYICLLDKTGIMFNIFDEFYYHKRVEYYIIEEDVSNFYQHPNEGIPNYIISKFESDLLNNLLEQFRKTVFYPDGLYSTDYANRVGDYTYTSRCLEGLPSLVNPLIESNRVGVFPIKVDRKYYSEDRSHFNYFIKPKFNEPEPPKTNKISRNLETNKSIVSSLRKNILNWFKKIKFFTLV